MNTMKTITLLFVMCISFSLSTTAQIQYFNGDNASDFETITKTVLRNSSLNDKEFEAFNNLVSSTQQFKVYSRKELRSMRKQLGETLKNDPASSEEYKAYINANAIGWTLVICELGAASYSIYNIVKAIPEEDLDKLSMYDKRIKIGSGITLGTFLTGLLVSHSATKHLRKASSLYDAAHKQVSLDDLSIIYGAESFQIGFEFKF